MGLKRVFEGEISPVEFGYIDSEEWVSVEEVGYETAAKHLKCSPQLIEAVDTCLRELKRALIVDLTEIWGELKE